MKLRNKLVIGSFTLIFIVCLIVGGSFMSFRNRHESSMSEASSSSTQPSILTTLQASLSSFQFYDYTSNQVSNWEHSYNQNIQKDSPEYVNLFNLTSGTMFEIISITNPKRPKLIGQSVKLRIGAQEIDKKLFPTIFLLELANHKNIPVMDLLSGLDWSRYLRSNGVSISTSSKAIVNSQMLILKATTGPQAGKELKVFNYSQFCSLL